MSTQIIQEPIIYNNAKGTITFNPNVIKIIAAIAALDTEGIYAISGGIFEGIAERLSNKQLYRGIKVEVRKLEVTLDINIIVEYNYAIPTVCQELKAALEQTISYMTGLEVTDINIRVDGIRVQDECEQLQCYG